MNKKKYLLDLSLEIDTADISTLGKDDRLLIVKEFNGKEIVIKLPLTTNKTAQEFIEGEIDGCGWMPKCNESEGFWLREKNIHDIDTGLKLVHDKTAQKYYLPH
jgi:hypothetical protein